MEKAKTIRDVLEEVVTLEGMLPNYKLQDARKILIDEALSDIKEVLLGMLPNYKKFDSQAKDQQQSDDRTYGYNQCREEIKKRIEEL